MSEHLNLKHEALHELQELSKEKQVSKAEHAEQQRRLEAVKQKAETEQTAMKHEARTAARHEAVIENPIDRLDAAEKANHGPAITAKTINQQLKDITLRRELQHIRRKLPAGQRALSTIIHQPLVRAVSESAGQTVSRPSGMLGGGLIAFIGTTIYLAVTKYYGYRYNFGVFILLFLGGFIVGVALELMTHLLTARRTALD